MNYKWIIMNEIFHIRNHVVARSRYSEIRIKYREKYIANI